MTDFVFSHNGANGQMESEITYSVWVTRWWHRGQNLLSPTASCW